MPEKPPPYCHIRRSILFLGLDISVSHYDWVPFLFVRKEFRSHSTSRQTFTWSKDQSDCKKMRRWSACASPQRDPTKLAQKIASVGELASYCPSSVSLAVFECLNMSHVYIRLSVPIGHHWSWCVLYTSLILASCVTAGCSLQAVQAAVLVVNCAPTFRFRSYLGVNWKLWRWDFTTLDRPFIRVSCHQLIGGFVQLNGRMDLFSSWSRLWDAVAVLSNWK